MHEAARFISPAAERNLPPIIDVLCDLLPASGQILEVASGPGQHIASLATAFPHLDWYPSEADPDALDSIRAWCATVETDNIHPPRSIDVTDGNWIDSAPSPCNAVVAINLLHIAPWPVAEGLLDGATRLMAVGGRLFVYGCFMKSGRHTSASNDAFDRRLRLENPSWGVRDIDDVEAAAIERGLSLISVTDMPANNSILVFSAIG